MTSSRIVRVRTFLAELRRRRVVRAGVLYVVAAFAVLQGADILIPALHVPDRAMTALVILAILGLPIAIALAWVFDLDPGGLHRTEPRPPSGTSGATDITGVTGMAGAGGIAGAAGVAGGAVAPPTVAVVPFLSMGGDEENEYFADGITEDVITHLSRIRALQVISRASVMPFKDRDRSLREIGEALGASALLDGSIRRAGQRVRIAARLVDARTDRNIWAESYDRELTDIFAIQTDVALQIARALEAELSTEERTRIGREPTTSVEAYQLYLKGRHWFIRFTPAGLRRAIEYYQRAVEADPAYALAYTGIALAHAELSESGAADPSVARPQAMAAAREALRLDPGLAEAHCAMAELRWIWDFDWEAAEAGFRRAIELCPSSADAYDLYGRLCSAVGRFDQALALQRKAQELDPLAHRLDVASTLLRAGRYAEAETEARRAVEFEPDQDRGRATLGWALMMQGRHDQGVAELERAVALTPDNPQWLAQLGQALAMAGRTAEARDLLARLEARAASDFVAPYHLAYIHTGLGEHDRAIDCLELAFEQRAAAVHGVRGSFLFRPLRSHPRFQALVARFGPPA